MHIEEWGVVFFMMATASPLYAADNAAPTTTSVKLTARQVVERIQKNLNCPWNEKTLDTFKAGDPDMPVTGVAVTFMTTFDVLQRAAASGKNLIITHEPTFYHGQDDTRSIETDKVLEVKRAFIKEHGLVIWRFHDHWHRRQPDGIMQGVIEKLGWKQVSPLGEGFVFQLPETTTRQLTESLRDKFKTDHIRAVGNPDMKVTRVAYSAGAPGAATEIKLLQRDDVEVLIVGETREWETIEYAQDAAAEGKRKALILLGHSTSEEAGMEYCARWLKGFVSEVPIEFIPSGDPFWSPPPSSSK
ncbi:MAG: Nif3-like dinuclear metal center hexameric protein [Candidatus Sumerlaeota bacterium]|nr:Nif3-like dinuclear metal center hexameric protein [Candidatus Sumerlaeota bacterium]